MKKINVMVIEDDFRIANIHKEMIESHKYYKVINSSRTAEEALNYLEIASLSVDLILLDIYIPDVTGLELLQKIKQDYPFISIIIASAANDRQTFISAKRLGVFDYLIKPIEIDRLNLAFERFYNVMTYEHDELNQKEIDNLLWQNTQQLSDYTINYDAKSLPKGIDSLTLNKIQSFFNSFKGTDVTAQTLAEEIGISRATARRYLEYLIGIDWLEASLSYGQIGRPQRIYKLHEQNEQN